MAINYQGGNDAVVTGAFQPFLQTLQKNYQYEQQLRQERQKEKNKLLLDTQKDLTKINSNGIRQADLPEFNRRMEEIKSDFFKLSQTSDPSLQRALKMKINEGWGAIDAHTFNSRENAKLYGSAVQSLQGMVGKGKVDEARKYLQSLDSKPSAELDRNAFDTSNYLFKYDPTKVDSAISRVAQSALSNPSNIQVGSSVIGGYSTTGGKRMDTVQTSTSVAEPRILESLSELAKKDRQVGAYVQDIIDSEGVDFNTAIAQLAQENADKFVRASVRDVTADKSKGVTVKVSLGDNQSEVQRTIVDDYNIARNTGGKRVVMKKYMQFEQPQTLGGLIRAYDPVANRTIEVNGTLDTKVVGLGTNNRGDEFAVVEYKEFPEDTPQVLLIDKDRYLNRSSFSKRDAEYIGLFEQEASRLKPTGGNKASTTAPRTNTTTPTTRLQGGSVR